MRVLLVEDNPAVQRTITGIFESAGHEVVVAENGLEALVRLRNHAYGAIVCDLALPYLQGTQFYAQLTEGYPELAKRVVFVTALATDRPTEEFLKATGQPYLSKPFEQTALLDAVDRVSREPEAR